MSEQDADVVVSGHIGGAYGVRGWVRINSYTDPAPQLLQYRPWLLEHKGRWRSVNVLEARVHQKGLVALIEGCEDRDAAERLRGQKVGVNSSTLPETEEGEYYWRDLMGLDVRNAEGEVLGQVDHLIATGANDVLVVKRTGHSNGEVLIPFIEQFVLDVDIDAGLIRVDWNLEASDDASSEDGEGT